MIDMNGVSGMGSRMRVFRRVVTLSACWAMLSGAPGWAQQPPVLSGSQVSEDALIDALAMDAPAEAPEGGKTRGFGPAPRPASPAAATRRPDGGGKANLMITFRTASAELTPESMRLLDTVARALQSDALAALAFRVEGHADPRGMPERNLALSAQRAGSVVSYLVQVRGVLPERLTSLGKGSAEPFDPQKPEAPENRRVTIVTTR